MTTSAAEPVLAGAERVAGLVREAGVRRGLDEHQAVRITHQALGWVEAWLIAPLRSLEAEIDVDSLSETVQGNAAHYGVWHACGAASETGAGFVNLHRAAIRRARGDVQKGTEAASETYLDVRTRLEASVDRAARGRSIPDFRHPGAIGEDNVRHYHAVQVRLRLQGKWEARRNHSEFDETRHQAPSDQAYRAAEISTQSVPLHFAALWYLADVRTRKTRTGKVKDQGWWWDMLLHGLDRVKQVSLGGDRNDPTEALSRLRLRFAVCVGLSSWLKPWARSQPYWQQVGFDLPDIDNVQARASVEDALERLRPAMAAVIESLEVSDAEARALVGTLLRGENVRTSLRHFDGDTPADRWQRVTDLGTEIGLKTAYSLNEDDVGGGGGGGGRSGHETHGERLKVMARLAAGEVPTSAQVVTLNQAVASCEDCAEAWAATTDAAPYLQATAAIRPQRRLPVLAAGLVLVAAALLIAPLVWPSGSQPLLRGADSAPGVHLDLYVVPAGSDQSLRYSELSAYHPGDRVYFSVSADAVVDGREVTVWVDGPEGEAEIGAAPARVAPVKLGDGGVFYEFEKTGLYRFHASSEGQSCGDETCVRREIEVVTP